MDLRNPYWIRGLLVQTNILVSIPSKRASSIIFLGFHVIKFNMLLPLVKDWIGINMKSCIAITIERGRLCVFDCENLRRAINHHL